MRGLGWRTDLARVLQHILPVLLRDAAALLQSLQVCELSVLAECEDEEIVELLGLLGPLALDDARASPGCLADVVRVFLLLRAGYCASAMQTGVQDKGRAGAMAHLSC